MLSAMVTTAGSAVGTAATARLIAIKAKAIKDSAVMPLARYSLPNESRKIKMQIPIITVPSFLPKTSRRFCNGVISSSASLINRVIFPISVCIPVATITARQLPVTAAVDEKSMFFRSLICFSSVRGIGSFSAGTLSPVREASSTFRRTLSMILASAGTLSPASIRMISPGTRYMESMVSRIPLRITLAFMDVIFLSASRERLAESSWKKPINAFARRMMRMMIESTYSPINSEKATAKRRI